MRLIRLPAALALILLAGLPIAGGPRGASAQEPAVNPTDFSSTIDNPLFPLSSLKFKLFLGEELDADTGEIVETKLESRVLDRTFTVAGVQTLVLEEKAYTDGELVEVALDYYAQHRDGSVWYFGEHVDNYENGVVINNDGQWFAGDGENRPGIIMQARPVVGQTYDQELAPGIAEDAATVLGINESVTVPSGSYAGCLKTRDFDKLDPDVVEFKFHCPGVGLVREEGEDEFLDLQSVERFPVLAPTAVATAAGTGGAAASPTGAPRETGVVAPNTGAGPEDAGLAWPAILLGGLLGASLVVFGLTRRTSGEDPR